MKREETELPDVPKKKRRRSCTENKMCWTAFEMQLSSVSQNTKVEIVFLVYKSSTRLGRKNWISICWQKVKLQSCRKWQCPDAYTLKSDDSSRVNSTLPVFLLAVEEWDQ